MHSIKLSPLSLQSSQVTSKAFTCPSAFLSQPLLRWDGSQHSALVPEWGSTDTSFTLLLLTVKHLSLYQSYPASLR